MKECEIMPVKGPIESEKCEFVFKVLQFQNIKSNNRKRTEK